MGYGTETESTTFRLMGESGNTAVETNSYIPMSQPVRALPARSMPISEIYQD